MAHSATRQRHIPRKGAHIHPFTRLDLKHRCVAVYALNQLKTVYTGGPWGQLWGATFTRHIIRALPPYFKGREHRRHLHNIAR